MTDEVREFWDDQSSTFDEEPDHGLRDPRVRAAWRELLLAHLPPAPATVLDLGCGTGSLSVLLAEEGYHVVGLDLSPRMVAAADAKAAVDGEMRGSVSFAVGDAADPAHSADAIAPAGPAASVGVEEQGVAYDVVLCRHVLWALPDRAEAVRRWVTLLRPGGRLVLVEGRWWTGGGLTAEQTQKIVGPLVGRLDTTALPDPVLWGGAIQDERYLVVASI